VFVWLYGDIKMSLIINLRLKIIGRGYKYKSQLQVRIYYRDENKST